MRTILFLLILIHGSIHILGFLKAYRIIKVDNITKEISVAIGTVWLITFCLLTVSSLVYISDNRVWVIPCFVGILISQILIIKNWTDAKFGTLPNLVILIVLIITFSTEIFNENVAEDMTKIISGKIPDFKKVLTNDDIKNLPYPVKTWIIKSGAIGKPYSQYCKVSQSIEMKTKQGQNDWLNAKAVQYFNFIKPSFIWKINMDVFPLINVLGKDKFVDGKGSMQIKLFGLVNMVDETGEKIDEASLTRFLAEMSWFPSTMINPYINWEYIDSLSALAKMDYKGTKGEAMYYFDKTGSLIKIIANRYMSNEPNSKKKVWQIEFKDEKDFSGTTLPSMSEVSWILDDGKWTWLRVSLSSVENFNPVERLSLMLSEDR